MFKNQTVQLFFIVAVILILKLSSILLFFGAEIVLSSLKGDYTY